jgi:hypothetical protein
LNGPWKLEEKNFLPDQRMMLITMVRVGNIIDQDKMLEVTRNVPADGLVSSRTGNNFNCLTWLLDTLVVLDDRAIVKLPCNIGTSV